MIGNIDNPSTWADAIGYGGDNFYAVVKNGVANFVNKDGQYISEKGYNKLVSRFTEGYAAVEVSGKQYIIDSNGEIVSPGFEKICSNVEWYIGNGVYLVKIETGGLYYYYNLFENKIIQNMGMLRFYYFKKTLDGIIAAICKYTNGKEYYMDTDGNIRDLKTMDIVVKGNIS